MGSFDLGGRAAIITGGNGGIGLGMAQALAAAGCSVSIWGRNAEKNKAAAASMAGAPVKIDTRVCDVTDVPSEKSAMAAPLATLRPLVRSLSNPRTRARGAPPAPPPSL